MSEDKVYDFCLDWQMNVVPKRELCKDFVLKQWSFSQFHTVAKKHSWFTNSMYALLYAEEFAN
jgi:hypothetical protein